MVFTQTDSLGAISDGLAFIKTACEQRGWLKFFDNHVVSQSIFCRFLNTAFNLSLVEMDQIKANFPAIDLGDSTNRIAYQVTSERGGDKVQHTLDKFVEHDLDKQYDTLRILIIGDRQSTYKTVTVPSSVQFDCERDIMGIEELVKLLGTLDLQRLEALQSIMIREVQYPGGSRKPDDDDTIKLEGFLTIDTALFDVFGCPGIRFTLVNKGKRSAKVARGRAFVSRVGRSFRPLTRLSGDHWGPGPRHLAWRSKPCRSRCFPCSSRTLLTGSSCSVMTCAASSCRCRCRPCLPSSRLTRRTCPFAPRFFDESELPVIVGEEVRASCDRSWKHTRGSLGT